MSDGGNGQISLDGFAQTDNILDFPGMDYERVMPVVFNRYLDCRDLTDDEIFDGFDELEVMTYSYGLKFIERISDKFKKVTILLGCPNIVSSDARTLVYATQEKAMADIRPCKKLRQRILEGTVLFNIVDGPISHEKLYIMTAEDGRTRIVNGSPNFSKSAFSGPGVQVEGIMAYDNDENAYTHFRSEFETYNSNPLKISHVPAECVDVVPDSDEEAVRNLPISKKIEQSAAGVIIDPVECESEEVTYYQDVSQINAKYKQNFQRVKIQKDKGTGAILLQQSHLAVLLKNVQKNEAKKKEEYQLPDFFIDYYSNQVSLNQKSVDLKNISSEDVKTDLRVLFEYFDGFDSFIGDTEATKHIYWKLMNLIFVSPFMAMLRYMAKRTQNAKEYFPIFVVINGKKSAGKTQFIAAMQKLMFNIEVETAPCELFTKTNIGRFFEGIKGVPVCFDDMAAKRFKDHSSNVVKNTEQYTKEEYSHHPIFIITTNEIDSLPPDLTKRIYYAEIPATQENENAIKKKRALNSLLSQITGAFYRAYLKEMLPAVSQMIDQMDPDSDTPLDWEPDVFKLSSETIIKLVQNAGFDPPGYMTVFEYKDYFGYNNIKEKARSVLLKKQKSNPDMIRTDRRENYLEINAGDEEQASKLYNLMPEIVEASTDGSKVLMKLAETEKYFQISFRKGLTINEILRKAKIKRG